MKSKQIKLKHKIRPPRIVGDRIKGILDGITAPKPLPKLRPLPQKPTQQGDMKHPQPPDRPSLSNLRKQRKLDG